MAEVVSLSVTDASNIARFPEGQLAGTVNNGARALEGMLARLLRDTQPYTTAGGTANALTIAANSTTAAAAAGESFTFKAASTNTAAATVNITPSGGSARGTVAIQKNAAALVGGEIVSGCFYTIDYDGAVWQLRDAFSGALADGTVGVPAWRFGADPNNGAYRIGTDNWGFSVAGALAQEFKSDGAILFPLQPALIARKGTDSTDVLGNGVNHQFTLDTELVDRGGDFATPTITIPQTGLYRVTANPTLDQIGAAHTRCTMILNNSAAADHYIYDRPIIGVSDLGRAMISGNAVMSLVAADTFVVDISVAASTQTIDVTSSTAFLSSLYVELIG